MERKRIPLAPAAVPAPLVEQLPYKPGQIVGAVPLEALRGQTELTEAERALLQRGGYREGDPLPDLSDTAAGRRLRAQLEQVVYEANDTAGLPPISPATAPLPLQPVRNIAELPPAEQAQAIQAFREMNELQQRMAQARTKAADAVPEHVQAIPGYLGAMAAAKGPPSAEIIDDIGLAGSRPHMRLKQQPAPASAPPPPPPSAPIRCPHCSFEIGAAEPPVTLTDKVNYIALVMGEQKRFRQSVTLFGGRITVVFRSLVTAEENLAFAQVDEDAKNGKIGNGIFYAATYEDYKMLMSIESVQRKGQVALQLAPIQDYAFDQTKNKTALPEFKEWLDAEVFLAASVRHAIGTAYYDFGQILKLMETKAPDSDFFNGID